MRPEDRPKAIGLVLGVVVVFGLVGMRVKSALGGADVPPPDQAVVPIGGSSGAPAATTTASKGITSAPVVVTLGGGGAQTSEKPKDLIVLPPSKPEPGKNPFRPRMQKGEQPAPESDGTMPSGPMMASNRQPPSLGQDSTNANGGFQGDTLPKIRGGGAAISPENPNGLDVQKDVESDMQLTGIITGGRAVAVIRVGAKDFVVSAGDSFGNGYRLIEASPTEVIISQGLVKRTLKIGIPMG